MAMPPTTTAERGGDEIPQAGPALVCGEPAASVGLEVLDADAGQGADERDEGSSMLKKA